MAKKNQAGSALVQALVGMGVLGVMGGVYASLVTQMGRAQQTLNQKMEQTDLKLTLLSAIQSEEICTWQFAGKTLPGINLPLADAAGKLAVEKIHLGKTVASPVVVEANKPMPGSTTGLVVNNLFVGQVTEGPGSNSFFAKLFIEFADFQDKASFAPMAMNLRFTTDAARVVTSCQGQGGGLPPETPAPDLSLAQLGNCEGQPIPSMIGTFSENSKEDSQAALNLMCSRISYPVPASGQVSYDSEECKKSHALGPSASVVAGAMARAYNIDLRCLPGRGLGSNTETGGPKLANLKSKDECMNLPALPQGATILGQPDNQGAANLGFQSVQWVCVSGTWMNMGNQRNF